MNQEKTTMRDAFIGRIYDRMRSDENIFFLSGDFGAPMLDRLREDFRDRFFNVGIAEQNLINVATGMALEGCTVYAYFIAPFIMRAYEQVRINLSMTSAVRPVNVNMIAVGSGLSYEVSGPTHHCLEDIALMRLLPNVQLFSPSDWHVARQFVDYSAVTPGPKYLRFDGKPLPLLGDENRAIDFGCGFRRLAEGTTVCLVATGFMSHSAMAASLKLAQAGISTGVLDLFMLKPISEERLAAALKGYRHIITLEEAFVGNGGIDSLINGLAVKGALDAEIHNLGIHDRYVFDIGSRMFLHGHHQIDPDGLVAFVKTLCG